MKKTKQSISEGGLLKLGLDLGRCQALAMVEGCTQIRMYEEADFKMKRVSPSPYSTSQYPWKFQGILMSRFGLHKSSPLGRSSKPQRTSMTSSRYQGCLSSRWGLITGVEGESTRIFTTVFFPQR